MNINWKIKDRDSVDLGRFRIYKDIINLPTGEETIYSYIEINRGVCILPILNDNQIICLKQYRYPVDSWELELPAGFIDKGENPREAAQRELEEETGYKADRWEDLGEFYPSPGSTNEKISLFAASNLKKKEKNLEKGEEIETTILTKQQFLNKITNGEFKMGAGLAIAARYFL